MSAAARRRWLAGVVVGLTVLWSAALVQAHLRARASVLDRLESTLLDWRILAFGPRPVPAGIMVAAIDDDTIQAAGAWPLPRHVLADAVTRLLAAGVRAVLVDALFLDPAASPGDDAALAAALSGQPVAIAAMDDIPPPGDRTRTSTCRLPIAALRHAAAVGTANIALDASGEARHMPMLLPCGGSLLPALPLRGAAIAVGGDGPSFAPDGVVIGGVSTSLDRERYLALRFYGPEATIPTVSLAAVLSGAALPPMQGRTVVIGATARGLGDRYSTAFDSVFPGVEIIATAVANLESGDALVRTPLVRRLDAAATLLLAVATAVALLAQRLRLGLLMGGGVLATWLVTVLGGFAYGVWFAMAVPLAAMLPAAALAGGARLVEARWVERQLRLERRALADFHSPALLARLTADPDFLSEPVEREVAAVFIDLSGFTGLSERLGPRITRDLLKQWHEIVEEGVVARGGFVASYMADGAMLVWGLVEAGHDDALRAVRTAVHLEARTLSWLQSVAPQTGRLDVKLGGHCGLVSLSRLGHAHHLHITAIGDTVNVASRLMEVAAAAHCTMSLSVDLVRAARSQGLTDSEAVFTSPRNVAIRGREKPIAACLWPASRECP